MHFRGHDVQQVKHRPRCRFCCIFTSDPDVFSLEINSSTVCGCLFRFQGLSLAGYWLDTEEALEERSLGSERRAVTHTSSYYWVLRISQGRMIYSAWDLLFGRHILICLCVTSPYNSHLDRFITHYFRGCIFWLPILNCTNLCGILSICTWMTPWKKKVYF